MPDRCLKITLFLRVLKINPTKKEGALKAPSSLCLLLSPIFRTPLDQTLVPEGSLVFRLLRWEHTLREIILRVCDYIITSPPIGYFDKTTLAGAAWSGWDKVISESIRDSQHSVIRQNVTTGCCSTCRAITRRNKDKSAERIQSTASHWSDSSI